MSVINLLPRYLYRGDSDPDNLRKLRETIKGGVILSNLCNGGNGREIFSKNLSTLINTHISVGWDKTHFLSFSSNEEVAFNYASTNQSFVELDNFDSEWDFALLRFDTSVLLENTFLEVGKGIYVSYFIPYCDEFQPKYKVILIDAFSHLKSLSNKITNLSSAINNAERDSEWLILPAHHFGHNGELTGKLDTNCISEKRIFKKC